MNITPEQIRDISVRNVEAFINDKVPLSQSVADAAAANDLNPEQVKRVVEATNSIAYLKLLGMAQDRTFEFPVADYKEVMRIIALPEKTAASNNPEVAIGQADVDDAQENHDNGLAYTDQNEDSETSETDKSASISDHEKKAALFNEYIMNRAELEKLAHAREMLKYSLADSIDALRKDPLVLEKLATVADAEFYAKLSPYLSKSEHVKSAEEVSTGHVFRKADLSGVTKLIELCKEATELAREEDRRLKLDKKAAVIIPKIIGGLGNGIGRVLGGIAGAGVGLAARGASAATKAVGGMVARKGITGTLGTAVGTGLDVLGASQHTPSVDIWSSLHG